MTTAPAHPPERSYQGLSLLYFRTLLARGPVGRSAHSVAQEYIHDLVQDPEIGMLCFWGLREPGDVGLYLGHDRLLILDTVGLPRIVSMEVVSEVYIGAMFWPTKPPTRRT